MTRKIEISAKTIVFTILFLLSLNLLWQIKELIFSLFIGFIIASALKPGVDYLEKRKLPRSAASLIIYILFIFFIVVIFNIVIPPLVGEIFHLFKNLPIILNNIFPNLPFSLDLGFINQNLPSITNQAVALIKGIFSNVIFVTSTLFLGFYFILEKSLARTLFKKFFDEVDLLKIETIINRGQVRMASWFWGEIILMVVIGTLTFIGLTIIGMKYALALSVLAGLLEVIPTLGPITSAVPSFLIGLSYSPVLGLSTIILNIIIQQLENNVVVPVVMKKAVGLHPIITLIVLMVGGKLAGILGVLLAVPTTIFIETIIIELQKFNKK